jgi:hypothetical protein
MNPDSDDENENVKRRKMARAQSVKKRVNFQRERWKQNIKNIMKK